MEENKNETLANPQNVTPNPEPNVTNTTGVGPIIETIPDNNIIEQPTNDIPQMDTIETLDVGPTPSIEPMQDNFGAVPVPPVFENENKKEKKDNKKIIYILLIVVLIAGVGFGIYYFLTAAKTTATTGGIVTKDLKLELGNALSENIDDYATISGYNKNECKIDTKNISLTKVGAYKFYVTCGEQVVEGTAIVDDTTNPEVITNEVIVFPNATITIEDFIESCVDASQCTYKFVDENEVTTALKTIGEHDIKILVSDEYNNESTISAKLVVSNDAPVKYLTCTGESEDVDDIYATLTNSYKFGVSSSNKIYNVKKISSYSFEESEDYLAIANNYNESTGINGTIGKATFNQPEKTIVIKADTTLEKMNTELNLTLPDDANTIQFYLTINGYTCK